MTQRSVVRASDVEPPGIVVQDGVDPPAFQDHVLAHLDAGYNLALWMLRDEHQASDALQDASLKAWDRFGSFRGGDGKSWFLAIVRTSAIDLARRARRYAPAPINQESDSATESAVDSQPLSGILKREHAALVNDVVWSLPEPMREILVLREVEGLSYAQIAHVLDVPIGTVMSRVSRARDAADRALRARLMKEPIDGL
jgi:RNA polymerase sigma-70 factor (ECF subfamily)